MPTIIEPTVGRVVWFYHEYRGEFTPPPLAAMIVAVHSDYCVNLHVFGDSGGSEGHNSVPLAQDDSSRPESGSFCEWMPYQKGQAAKTEELEAKIEHHGPYRCTRCHKVMLECTCL